MKLVHKIDDLGFYIEDAIYKEEWSVPTADEQNDNFTPVLLNPIEPAKGLVAIQPIGFHKPRWDFQSNQWIEGDTVAVLDNAKQSKINKLKQSYEEANSSDIDYLNKTFQADPKSQALIANVLSAGALPTGFFWKDLNNDNIPMTFNELQGLSMALVSRGLVNFSRLSHLKQQVNAVETLDELEMIEF